MFERNILISTLLFIIQYCSAKNYTNFTLYRGIPVNESHLKFFENLPDFYDVSFWRPPGLKNKPVDFIIGPGDKKSFLRAADEHGLNLTTVMEDVQKAFDEQTVKSYIRRRTESFDWQNYFKVEDIYNWLHDLRTIYPKELSIRSIGKTYENRHILAARIVLENARIRSKIIIEGGIHAREWISPAFVTYLIDQILHSRHSENELLKRIAHSHEWYFVPVLNPDGYEYTYTDDRLWRKNRHNGNLGVDLNRNFGVGFGSVGISKNPRSDIYCGVSAFSEMESQAMAYFVLTQSKNLEFYFGFHAYGQYMILPYAHTKYHMENFDEVNKMAKVAADKIKNRYKTKYSHGTAFDTVGYMTSGVSGCWVKKTFQVPYVVTFELRDEGKYGFALPPNQILPTCQETLDGVLSIIDQGTRKPRRFHYYYRSRAHDVVLSHFVITLIAIGHFFKN